MKAKYIIRLDDACENMHLKRWQEVLSLMEEYKVRPIIGVVPHNEDKTISFGIVPKFWDIVRSWQNKDFHIAMHGCNHIIRNNDNLLLHHGNRSEFAHLTEEQIKNKLERAWKIFKDEGVNPKIWMAPAHGLDWLSLKLVKEITGINIITDGLALRPYFYKDFVWIPQQIWHYKKFAFGTWTICLHPSTMEEMQIENLEIWLTNIQKENAFEDVSNYFRETRKRDVFDFIFEKLYYVKSRI